MQNRDTIVLKFGGASVAEPEHFSRIAEIISLRRLHYQKLVVVVSAMGNTTNQLAELAKKVNPTPPQREYDMLVSVGERISISLLAMALSLKGIDAVSFTGSQSGIITCDRHTEARIVDVKPRRLLPVLEAGKIAIVAGFQGVSEKGEITTLGRGGSDTTAVALSVALEGAKVEFFKDVPGVFAADPKQYPQAKFFDKISYEEALGVVNAGAKVLHDRCIKIAKNNAVPLIVRSFHEFDHQKKQGTLIFDENVKKPPRSLYENLS